MPRVVPRRGRFQISKALAAGISGYTAGRQDRRQRERQDAADLRVQQRHDAALQKYQETDAAARQQESERNAARQYLVQQAEIRRQERQAEVTRLFGEGGGMTSEEFARRKAEIAEGAARIKAMAPTLTPFQTLALLQEYETGQKQQIIAEEYQRIDQRLMELENNEFFPMPSEVSKPLRQAVEEGIAPNEINRRLDQFQRGAAEMLAQQRHVERGVQKGMTYLEVLQQRGDVTDANLRWAESLVYEWAMGRHRTMDSGSLIAAMQAASYGVGQKGWDPRKPQVQPVPVPVKESKGATPFADMNREQRLQYLQELTGGRGSE